MELTCDDLGSEESSFMHEAKLKQRFVKVIFKKIVNILKFIQSKKNSRLIKNWCNCAKNFLIWSEQRINCSKSKVVSLIKK